MSKPDIPSQNGQGLPPIALTTADLLGHDPSPQMVEFYTRARRGSAEQALGRLVAANAEYERMQGDLNMSYIEGLVTALPVASAGFEYEVSRGAVRLRDSICVDNITTGFVVNPKATPEVIPELTGIRGTYLWWHRKYDEVITVNADKEYAGKLADESLWSPYALIGHRQGVDGSVEVLLYSAVAKNYSFRFSYDDKRTRYESYNPGSYGAQVRFKRDLVQARMPAEHYTRLLAMQDALVTGQLSENEIRGAYNASDNTYNVHPATMPVLRVGNSKRRFLGGVKEPPSHIGELSEVFDVTVTGAIRDRISPAEFLSYNVATDTLRLAAMLGRVGRQSELMQGLIDKSPIDPDIAMINGQ